MPRRGVDVDLARQHDLLELPGADPLDAPADRRLVVRGRHRADHLVVTDRGRDRAAAAAALAARPAAAATRAATSATVSSGSTSSIHREPRAPVRRASDTSGTINEAGANPSTCGRPRRRRSQTRIPRAPPGPARRAVAVVGERRRGQRPPARRHARRSAQRPSASSARTRPSAATAVPSRSGCSRQNHGSPGRREAATTALGSSRRRRRGGDADQRGSPRRPGPGAARLASRRRSRCLAAALQPGAAVASARVASSAVSLARRPEPVLDQSSATQCLTSPPPVRRTRWRCRAPGRWRSRGRWTRRRRAAILAGGGMRRKLNVLFVRCRSPHRTPALWSTPP